MPFTAIHADIKTSETDTHVFFLNGPFSQWYPSNFRASIPVEDNNDMVFEFHCCEQYMMARKAALFGDMDMLATIIEVQQHPTRWQDAPKLCKELGKKVINFDQKVWDENNDDIVFDGNFAKFDQNGDLRTFMMSFGDKIIVEGAWYDSIWGVKLAWDDPAIIDPANWQGQNKLGNVLMTVRDILRADSNVAASA